MNSSCSLPPIVAFDARQAEPPRLKLHAHQHILSNYSRIIQNQRRLQTLESKEDRAIQQHGSQHLRRVEEVARRRAQLKRKERELLVKAGAKFKEKFQARQRKAESLYVLKHREYRLRQAEQQRDTQRRLTIRDLKSTVSRSPVILSRRKPDSPRQKFPVRFQRSECLASRLKSKVASLSNGTNGVVSISKRQQAESLRQRTMISKIVKKFSLSEELKTKHMLKQRQLMRQQSIKQRIKYQRVKANRISSIKLFNQKLSEPRRSQVATASKAKTSRPAERSQIQQRLQRARRKLELLNRQRLSQTQKKIWRWQEQRERQATLRASLEGERTRLYKYIGVRLQGQAGPYLSRV